MKQTSGFSSLSFILKALGLSLFWVILSGKLDPIHLSFGIATALGISYIHTAASAPNPSTLSLAVFCRTAYRSLIYVFWLMSRIVLAAIHVSKLILNPKMPIAPSFFTHRTPLKKTSARVLFANSITLTPGTITSELNDDEYVVHRLDLDSAGDIDSGLMEEQISKIFT